MDWNISTKHNALYKKLFEARQAEMEMKEQERGVFCFDVHAVCAIRVRYVGGLLLLFFFMYVHLMLGSGMKKKTGTSYAVRLNSHYSNVI